MISQFQLDSIYVCIAKIECILKVWVFQNTLGKTLLWTPFVALLFNADFISLKVYTRDRVAFDRYQMLEDRLETPLVCRVVTELRELVYVQLDNLVEAFSVNQ